MTLAVDVRHRLGAFSLDARFTASGRLTALFGPSGSGKTSLVNAIAGLIRPDHGRIVSDGRTLVETATRTFVPAHRRRIGYVFQDARLFPHLTVAQNLRYGRWFASLRRDRGEMGTVVDLLDLKPLLGRRPARLSGGEKQRVAIGRALLAQPELLLMDEPLAALDDARKNEIIPFIERLRDHDRVPIIYVSHSVPEVARLASDMVVLSAGRVTAAGPTADILLRLDLLSEDQRGEGGSILDAAIAETADSFGITTLATRAGSLRVAELGGGHGDRIRIRIRARDVLVATQRPEGLSALNCLPGRIRTIAAGEGALTDVAIDCGGEIILARITRLSVNLLGLAQGREVFAVVKSVTFDRTSLSKPTRPDAEAPVPRHRAANGRG